MRAMRSIAGRIRWLSYLRYCAGFQLIDGVSSTCATTATNASQCHADIMPPGTACDAERLPARLLADAETCEDHAQQIVGCERAGERRQSAMRDAQFLGEELERRCCERKLRGRCGKMQRRLAQRGEMALAREKAMRGVAARAGDCQQLALETFHTFAGERRQAQVNNTFVRPHAAGTPGEVRLVVDDEPRQRGGKACKDRCIVGVRRARLVARIEQ